MAEKREKRTENTRGEERKITHIIPITLTKLDSGSPSLDAGAIDQHMDLAAHGFERFVENTLDRIEVANVAFDNLHRAGSVGGGGGGGGGECLEGVDRVEVGRAGTLDEADVGTGFGEGDGACCADT